MKRPICSVCKEKECEKSSTGFRTMCWTCRNERHRTPEWFVERRKVQRQKRKQEVIGHYGSKCACCGESNIAFLTIDHINGDGAQQRKRFNLKGDRAYNWIVQSGFPNDLQVLCFNCNCGRQVNGGICPHKKHGPVG